MKHLIIYAHPSDDSYNRSVLDTVVNTLKNQGHTVEVHDLYKQKFDPVLTAADLASYRQGNLAPEVASAQKAVAEADSLTFLFPVWWAAAPAILKGWLDRVFSFGFAYGLQENGSIQQLLKGKKGAVVVTQGTPKAIYDQTGMAQSMGQVFDDGVFRFTGIEPTLHLVVGSVNGGEPRPNLQRNLDEISLAFSQAF